MELYRIHQRFDRPRLDDVEESCRDALGAFDSALRDGAEIAIAVGSRGIANIDRMVRVVVEYCKGRGARPFIVPAMGSHGGASAEGQAALLASYGIDEARVGAPVRSSMEVVELDRGDNPVKVYLDAHAHTSDGVILINRIKPHTDFHGDYESGLAKMLVIGLGKHKQALAIHSHGVVGLKKMIAPTARRVLASGAIIGGLAVVENAYDETMAIHGIPAAEIMEREPGLLRLAAGHMPRLPVDDIDILMVDWIGKNISGVGMDPTIIGRMAIPGEPEPVRPRIGAIVIDDLTPESHGNALGIGLAQAITEKLYRKIDFDAVYENVYTSTFLERAKAPVVAPTARRAYEFALRSLGEGVRGVERVMRIRDTLHLDTVYASRPIVAELIGDETMEIDSEPRPLFAANGDCTPFSS